MQFSVAVISLSVENLVIILILDRCSVVPKLKLASVTDTELRHFQFEIHRAAVKPRRSRGV